MKKIAIIGGGVAGLSAAIYALRSNAEVTLFEQFGLGGYTANLTKIHNYPSYAEIEGWELASNMAKHAKSLGLKDVVRQRVDSLTRDKNGGFKITTSKQTYDFNSVVVATGTTRNKLGIEDAYVGKGVSYCATCDGSFYKGLQTAVIGGNKHAVSEALYLADLCSTVYLLVSGDNLVLSEGKRAKLDAKSNIRIVYNARVTEIYGDEKVEGLKYVVNGEQRDLDVCGIFISVGSSPATDFIRIEGLQSDKGFIVTDETCQSSIAGLFAAGDVTNGKLKQIVTACADGAKAGTYASAYAAAKTAVTDKLS